jgi:N-acetylglucosaminyl-diphospho-decaprenol L-rhamnosyltransferase
MHVAICIVSYRNPADVAHCLSSLSRSTYADFEVVICENGGEAAFEGLRGAVPDRLSSGQPVQLVLAPGNLGYAGGVNLCMARAADADAWWILNPDTDPAPDALDALRRRLDEGDCDLVGGTILTPDGRVDSRALRWWPWLARSASIDHEVSPDAPFQRDEVEDQAAFVCGGCMFVSRRFLEVVGPMRNDYFLYCEEIEWCLRGRRKGLRIGYAPDAMVVHFKGTTTGVTPDLRQRPRGPVFLDERNKIHVTRDIFPARMPFAALAALLLILLRFGRRRAWKQLGWALSGWTAGVMNRRGVPSWLR